MRLIKLGFIIMLLAAAFARVGPPARAQTAGTAALTSPLEGAVVTGVVPLNGTAAHPSFVRYELAFAYLPNPTNTWFSVQEAAATPITDGVLGRWDTTQIADGLYTLRLRVFFSDQDFLESIVPSVRVQNAASAATPVAAGPTPTPNLTPVSTPNELTTPLPTLAPTSTALIVLPPTPTARPSATPRADAVPTPMALPSRLNLELLQSAFWAGVQLTLISFGVMGVYLLLRTLWRR